MSLNDSRPGMIWTCLLLVSCLLVSSTAAAQEGGGDQAFYEPTEEQLDLNDEAVKSLIDGDPERAVTLLKKSLALGEYNVTYLNLGRAYQKLGNCTEGRRSLHKAQTAPALKAPKRSFVTAKANEYLAELEEDCDVPDGVKWGLIGGGGALTVFGGFALLRAAQLAPGDDDFTRDENGIVTDPSQRTAFDQRRSSRTWSTIGISALSVGLVGLGLGTYFAMSGASTESQPTASVGPDGSFSFGWHVRF